MARSLFDRDEQRRQRETAVLDVASDLFNRGGFGHVTLDQVAARLGITKAALYHYVENKDELVYRCYMRTCELIREQCRAAEAQGNSGLDRLTRAIRGQLSSLLPPIAVLSEVPSLPAEWRRRVRSARQDYLAISRKFIEDGIKDGSIAPCNANLVNAVVNGTVAGVPLWFSDKGRSTLEEVAETIIDLVSHGLSPPRRSFEALPALTDDATRQRQAAFNRAETARMKLDAFLRVATGLFNRLGVNGTSLDAVVQELKVTKGAFYHYVKNKEDLLYQCYLRSLQLQEDCWQRATSRGGSRLQNYEASIRCHVHTHFNERGPLALYVGMPELTQTHRSEIEERVRRDHRRAIDVLDEGIAQGSIRTVNSTLVQLSIASAVGWLPKWHPAEAEGQPADVADAFAQVFVLGLAPRKTRAASS